MKYRIGHNGRDWTIEERYVHGDNSKTPGRVEWKPRWYYGQNLHRAAQRLLDLHSAARYQETGHGIGRLIQAVQEAEKAVIEEVAEFERRCPHCQEPLRSRDEDRVTVFLEEPSEE